MEFKIETRETFSIITPVLDELNAILADELVEMLQEKGHLGSSNLIIDLSRMSGITPDTMDKFVLWHESAYAAGCSLVFTQPKDQVLKMMRGGEKDLLINLAPRMDEAIDIVSMEILERDLLGEE